MIPTFDVDLFIDVDPRRLRLPTPGEVAYGVGDNREYCWPGRMTWDDARTAIDEDTRLLEAADAESTTEDDFEDAIYEQGGRSSYGWAELGVRSTVVALLAAGRPTAAAAMARSLRDIPMSGSTLTRHGF